MQGSIVYYDTELNLDLRGGTAWVWTLPEAICPWGDPLKFATFAVFAEAGLVTVHGSPFYSVGFAKTPNYSTEPVLAQILPGGLIDHLDFGFVASGFLLAKDSTAYYGFVIRSKTNVHLDHFGWVELSTSAGGDALTIHRWAIEDQANTAIAAGAVPEAADFALGLGALAAGAATVLRKRRKEAA